MKVQTNYDLTELNTLGVTAHAKKFVAIQTVQDITELFGLPEFQQSKKVFLGGGSNVLFTKDFDGFVVLNKLKGIEIVKEDSESVIIRSMSGEIWHDLVSFAVDRGY